MSGRKESKMRALTIYSSGFMFQASLAQRKNSSKHYSRTEKKPYRPLRLLQHRSERIETGEGCQSRTGLRGKGGRSKLYIKRFENSQAENSNNSPRAFLERGGNFPWLQSAFSARQESRRCYWCQNTVLQASGMGLHGTGK